MNSLITPQSLSTTRLRQLRSSGPGNPGTNNPVICCITFKATPRSTASMARVRRKPWAAPQPHQAGMAGLCLRLRSQQTSAPAALNADEPVWGSGADQRRCGFRQRPRSQAISHRQAPWASMAARYGRSASERSAAAAFVLAFSCRGAGAGAAQLHAAGFCRCQGFGRREDRLTGGASSPKAQD